MPVELISADASPKDVIDIITVTNDGLDGLLGKLSVPQQNWIALKKFAAKAGEICVVPSDDGGVGCVLFGAPKASGERLMMSYAPLVSVVPNGAYRFVDTPSNETIAALSWLLESYRFTRYKDAGEERSIQLVVSDDAVSIRAHRMDKATTIARDLINTPTNDMTPSDLSRATHDLADTYGASFEEIIGDDLLNQNFPLIHAVGRASVNQPRLLDLKWGSVDAPKITLVGKGVCFDTGGLNIKTGSNMTLMKKDMGGAANVLGLALMIMDAKLPVRLRVLIPAVENSIAGDAFRPGDILPSRAGLSVEIANTDAEGRLVLADALTYADEETPDVLIDMATLTGAARVALGPDLPPFYTNDDGFADELHVRAQDMEDPVWRMPLWDPYQSMLDTPIADVNHAPAGGFAGSITAALFLARFVKSAAVWGHFDIYGWAPNAKPARPKGGEAQAIRALYGLLEARFG